MVRNTTVGAEVARDIAASTGNDRVSVSSLDLIDLDSYVRSATCRFTCGVDRGLAALHARAAARIPIAGPRQLRTVLNQYADHYHQHWPHRARNLRPPDGDDIIIAVFSDPTTARIRRRVLGRTDH
jgi:hypothetical protein